MEKCCGYRSDNNTYFNRYHVTKMIYVACGLMALTQLFVTITYLSFHVWWWFITLGFIIGANICLVLAIKHQDARLMKVLLVYQLIFVLVYLGSTLDMLILLIHPIHHSWIYHHCVASHLRDYSHCVSKTRINSLIFFPFYFLFTVINLWCFVVLWNYHKYCNGDSNRQPSYAPNRTFPTATSRPATNNVPMTPRPAETTIVSPPPLEPVGTGGYATAGTYPAGGANYGQNSTVYTTSSSSTVNYSSSQQASTGGAGFGDYSSQQRGFILQSPQLAAPDSSPFNVNWDAAQPTTTGYDPNNRW